MGDFNPLALQSFLNLAKGLKSMIHASGIQIPDDHRSSVINDFFDC